MFFFVFSCLSCFSWLTHSAARRSDRCASSGTAGCRSIRPNVRKVALEGPPGQLPLDDERVRIARSRLFGSWEMNWIAYNFAHDVRLPGSKRPPLGYLMYPQGETANGPLDSLDPDSFKYTITVKEII
jgi:hypothetical protein